MVTTPPICGDDWGMIYSCFTHINGYSYPIGWWYMVINGYIYIWWLMLTNGYWWWWLLMLVKQWQTTHDWEWLPYNLFIVIWEMVYYCFTYIILT